MLGELTHSRSMAELQQWRKKMQTSCARTPVPQLDIADRKDSMTDPVPTPVTPRLKLRPKLSSYFSQPQPTSPGAGSKPDSPVAVDNLSVAPSLLTTPFRPSKRHSIIHRPEVEKLMDMLMATILSEPWQSIDPKHVGSLLSIFEAYRQLCDENANLVDSLEISKQHRAALTAEHGRAEQRWLIERQVYTLEIKRLELIIAKGKRGLADVAKARQGSLVRQGPRAREVGEEDAKETIFEFLKNSKKEQDLARSAQRAVFRTVPNWPGLDMTSRAHNLLPANPVSRKASSEDLTTRRLYGCEAPSIFVSSTRPGTGRDTDVSDPYTRHETTSQLDDTSSAFSSSGGDLLPDEFPISDAQFSQLHTQPRSISMDETRALCTQGVLAPLSTNLSTSNATRHRSEGKQAETPRNSVYGEQIPSTRMPGLSYRVAAAARNGRLIHRQQRFSFKTGDDHIVDSPFHHDPVPPPPPPPKVRTPVSDMSSPRPTLSQRASSASTTLIPSPTFTLHARPRRDAAAGALARAQDSSSSLSSTCVPPVQMQYGKRDSAPFSFGDGHTPPD